MSEQKQILSRHQGSDYIVVVHGVSLVERITAGRYRSSDVDVCITEENFPCNEASAGEWEWRLFYFARKVSSESAAATMRVGGWYPALIEHVLAFGEKYPEKQYNFPIIGLGSRCCLAGQCYVVGLDVSIRRELSLYSWDDEWDESFRFLAMRRIKKQ